MPGLKRLNQILLGLYLFFLPWQTVYIFDAKLIDGVKWQYGTGLLFATEILLWLIVMMHLIIIIKNKKSERQNFKLDRVKLVTVISLWFLIAWSGLSIIWAPEQTAGFYNWFHLLEAAGLFFIVLAGSNAKKRIYLSLTLAGVLQALLAIWQFFSQSVDASKWLGLAGHLPWETGTIIIESSGRWLRAYGAFAHPNILGGFLVVCFFVTIIPALLLNGKRNTPWRIIASLLIITGIFFSFSRSAWLALAAGLIIIFVNEIIRAKKSTEPAKTKYRNLAKYFFAPLLLVAVLGYLYQPLIFTRTSTADRLETYSVTDRLDYLTQAKDMINSYWLLGVGEGNYTYNLYQNKAAKTAWHYQPVHNIFLLILAELGIVGLLAFLLFLISCLWYFISNIHRTGLGFNLLSFPAAIIIIGCFDHYLWTSYAGIIILFLSFALILRELPPSQDN